MPSCHPHSATLLASYLLAMLATRLWSFYHFIWPADSSLLEVPLCLLSCPMRTGCLTLLQPFYCHVDDAVDGYWTIIDGHIFISAHLRRNSQILFQKDTPSTLQIKISSLRSLWAVSCFLRFWRKVVIAMEQVFLFYNWQCVLQTGVVEFERRGCLQGRVCPGKCRIHWF